MDDGEHCESRAAVDEGEGRPAAHQHGEAEDECHVEKPLARVESALVPAEPASEDRGGPAGEPSQLGPAEAHRFGHE